MDFSYASALMSLLRFSLNIYLSSKLLRSLGMTRPALHLHFQPRLLDVRERNRIVRVLLHHRIGHHDPRPVELLQPPDDDMKPPNRLRRSHAYEAPQELLIVRIL